MCARVRAHHSNVPRRAPRFIASPDVVEHGALYIDRVGSGTPRAAGGRMLRLDPAVTRGRCRRLGAAGAVPYLLQAIKLHGRSCELAAQNLAQAAGILAMGGLDVAPGAPDFIAAGRAFPRSRRLGETIIITLMYISDAGEGEGGGGGAGAIAGGLVAAGAIEFAAAALAGSIAAGRAAPMHAVAASDLIHTLLVGCPEGSAPRVGAPPVLRALLGALSAFGGDEAAAIPLMRLFAWLTVTGGGALMRGLREAGAGAVMRAVEARTGGRVAEFYRNTVEFMQQ
jgi:hypothetical protein